MAAPLRGKAVRRPYLSALILFALFTTLVSAGVVADEQNWLPPGSSTEMRSDPPDELIRPGTVRDEKWLYGRLLFHSPAILGEKAVRIGLSCNSCHTNGHVNKDFYINGLSDRPGRVDITHRFWQAGYDDRITNPIDIPSLRGSRDTAPYGTVNIFPDLHAFTGHVIVTEFAGAPPSPESLDALVTFIKSLDIKDLKKNTPIVTTSTDMSYLPLLRAPLEERNLAELDKLVDLIRSDYGHRAAQPNSSTETIRRDVAMLRALRDRAAANDYAAAHMIYKTLTAGQ